MEFQFFSLFQKTLQGWAQGFKANRRNIRLKLLALALKSEEGVVTSLRTLHTHKIMRTFW